MRKRPGGPARNSTHRRRHRRTRAPVWRSADDGCMTPPLAPASGQVRSTTLAAGALFLTDWMPFSIAAADEYISLRPITWPLAAFSVK